jgi:hypothetical protein
MKKRAAARNDYIKIHARNIYLKVAYKLLRALATFVDASVHGNYSRARPYCIEHLEGETMLLPFASVLPQCLVGPSPS